MSEEPDVPLLAYAKNTVLATATEAFADTSILKTGKVWIAVGTATAMTLEVTHDGTNYCNGPTIAANSCVVVTDVLGSGDTFNVRQSSGGNVTIRWLNIWQ